MTSRCRCLRFSYFLRHLAHAIKSVGKENNGSIFVSTTFWCSQAHLAGSFRIDDCGRPSQDVASGQSHSMLRPRIVTGSQKLHGYFTFKAACKRETNVRPWCQCEVQVIVSEKLNTSRCSTRMLLTNSHLKYFDTTTLLSNFVSVAEGATFGISPGLSIVTGLRFSNGIHGEYFTVARAP